MGTAIRCRLAKPEQTTEITELLAGAFRVPIDPATWDWYAYGNPFGETRAYLATDESDAPVGLFAFTPVPLRIHGEPVTASSGHHLMLKRSFQGGGPLMSLSRQALAGEAARGVALALGLPNPKSHQAQKALMKWVDFCFLDCLYQRDLTERRQHCRQLETFPDEFDGFYRRLTRNLDFCVEKNAKWMNWRFSGRPGKPYSAYGAFDSTGLCGYVVLKRWQEPDGYRKAHIIDLHGENDDALAELIAAAESYAADCQELNLWAAPGFPYQRVLEARGFIPRSSARQPMIARTLAGPPLQFPSGCASFSYADGDFVY